MVLSSLVCWCVSLRFLPDFRLISLGKCSPTPPAHPHVISPCLLLWHLFLKVLPWSACSLLLSSSWSRSSRVLLTLTRYRLFTFSGLLHVTCHIFLFLRLCHMLQHNVQFSFLSPFPCARKLWLCWRRTPAQVPSLQEATSNCSCYYTNHISTTYKLNHPRWPICS